MAPRTPSTPCPLPHAGPTAVCCCCMQLYDDTEVKLNDVVEVVGVLRCGVRGQGAVACAPLLRAPSRWLHAGALGRIVLLHLAGLSCPAVPALQPCRLLPPTCSVLLPRSRVPELAAAHMQQGEGGQVRRGLLLLQHAAWAQHWLEQVFIVPTVAGQMCIALKYAQLCRRPPPRCLMTSWQRTYPPRACRACTPSWCSRVRAVRRAAAGAAPAPCEWRPGGAGMCAGERVGALLYVMQKEVRERACGAGACEPSPAVLLRLCRRGERGCGSAGRGGGRCPRARPGLPVPGTRVRSGSVAARRMGCCPGGVGAKP